MDSRDTPESPRGESSRSSVPSQRRLHQRRIRRRRQLGNTARPALPPSAQPTEPSGKAAEIANSVFGAGSLILALMLYTGFVHSRAYYAYFHLDVFSVGFDPVEMALRSLRLATFPVLITLSLAGILPRLPGLLPSLGLPGRITRRVDGAARAVARAHLAFVAAGVILLLAWRFGQPWSFRWAAPLLVAVGLLLGQSGAAGRAAGSPSRPWHRAVPVITASLFLMWVVALAAGELGRQDARHDAEQLVRRVSVVVLSTEQLSIRGPGLKAEDLGKDRHFRYRYSGLRLLVERDRRHYLLPLNWHHDTDATYVIEDDENIRIDLYPGTQPRR
ncbi:hypothetical protein [Streptomyces sp. NPDC021622]|uniref:hypothetical protein n=1 Tax=Streptomyces sp. NPDC021622 TaxID=3155013 RepID=UPI0033C3E32D